MKSTSAYPRTISTPASPNQGEAATPVPPVPETFFREERRKISNEKKKTVVVKTDHSAVIADLKYVYFCADYVSV